MHASRGLHLHVESHAFFSRIAPHVHKHSCHTCYVMPQGVDMMTAKLTNSLRGADVTVRQAADAIKHLLHLHAEGARSTKNLDPVKLYLEAQVRLVSISPFFRVPILWYVRFFRDVQFDLF